MLARDPIFELRVLGVTARAALQDLRRTLVVFANAARAYPAALWRSYREARRWLLEFERYRERYGADQVVLLEHSSTVLVNVHPLGRCRGECCPLHRRSNHGMRGWPQHWRADRGIVERTCRHGVGHPDPDDPTEDRTHGCDGCCVVAARAH